VFAAAAGVADVAPVAAQMDCWWRSPSSALEESGIRRGHRGYPLLLLQILQMLLLLILL